MKTMVQTKLTQLATIAVAVVSLSGVIFSPTAEARGSSSDSHLSPRECRDLAWKETKHLNNPYWQKIQKEILLKLSGKQVRGCEVRPEEVESRIQIFADDYEFLDIQNRAVEVYFDYNPIDGGVKNQVQITGGGEKPFAISLIVDNYLVPVYTDSCSPKRVLAELAANIEDSLKLSCGAKRDLVNTADQIQVRYEKMLDILSHDPTAAQ